MSDKPNPYDLGEVGQARRERAGGLRAARGILGPRPDDEEPPEVTIRRGRGDSDAELYDYMRKLWAEQKTDNARLKAELADKQETVDLFVRCMQRANRLWREAHPESPPCIPDAAEAIVWLKEQVDKMAERRCETCAKWDTIEDCGLMGLGYCRDTNQRDKDDFCSRWQEKEDA